MVEDNSESIILKKFGDYNFYVRHGSSDEKTIQEIINRKGYARRGFSLESKKWLDLGANIGAFTVMVAKLGAHVRAFEPDPTSFWLLEQNVKANGVEDRVELHQKAVVADKRKAVPFHVNSARKNYWRNSTVKAWKGGFTLEVEAVHCDSVFHKDEDCKMDIEGAEMPILEALKAVPQRMVFEWSFDIDRSIPRFSKVIERLRKKYTEVAYSKFNETLKAWPGEWFPPCRTVWCT